MAESNAVQVIKRILCSIPIHAANNSVTIVLNERKKNAWIFHGDDKITSIAI